MLKHTIHIAIAVNALVVDDRGRRQQALIFPFILVPVWLPAWLYNRVTRRPRLPSLGDWLTSWQADLGLVIQAVFTGGPYWRICLGG